MDHGQKPQISRRYSQETAGSEPFKTCSELLQTEKMKTDNREKPELRNPSEMFFTKDPLPWLCSDNCHPIAVKNDPAGWFGFTPGTHCVDHGKKFRLILE